MKKKIFLCLLVVCSLIFSACVVVVDTSKGYIAVRNESENKNYVITEVWVQETNSSGYSRVYSGEIKKNKVHFVEVKEGSYRVKVRVEDSTYSPWVFYEYFETGYNNNRYVSYKTDVYAIFDGKGLYFQ